LALDLTLVSYTANNGTFGIKYKPLDELTIRTSYSTAFLPPTALQLLTDPMPQFGIPIVDPKNGEAYNVIVTSGGNPALQPQRAKTWDLGAVWEPHESVLDGLRVDLEITASSNRIILWRPLFSRSWTTRPSPVV